MKWLSIRSIAAGLTMEPTSTTITLQLWVNSFASFSSKQVMIYSSWYDGLFYLDDRNRKRWKWGEFHLSFSIGRLQRQIVARPAHQQLFSFPFSSTYWSRSGIRTRLFGRLSGFSSVWVFAKLCYFHITIRDLISNFLIMTISSAGLKLATGTKDGQIHLWEVPSGLPLDTLSGKFLHWITLSRVFGWCWSFVCFCIRPFEWGICRQIQPRWIQTGVRFSCLFMYFYLSACFQPILS